MTRRAPPGATRLAAGEASNVRWQLAASRVAPGGALRVTVSGYDDAGRGVRIAGATVRLGAGSAVTGTDGVATVAAPAAAGTAELEAQAPGTVPSFPRRVRVG